MPYGAIFYISFNGNRSTNDQLGGSMTYSIKWTSKAGEDLSYSYSLNSSVYGMAQALNNSGSTDIKIYNNGVLIDHYIQGRTEPRVPSVPDTFRQLELF